MKLTCFSLFYISLGVSYRQWGVKESPYWRIQSCAVVRGGFRSAWWVAPTLQASNARGSVPLLGLLQGSLSRQPLWYAVYINGVSCYSHTDRIEGCIWHLINFSFCRQKKQDELKLSQWKIWIDGQEAQMVFKTTCKKTAFKETCCPDFTHAHTLDVTILFAIFIVSLT